ncbi:MAG TPA: type II toxin-antitoxin system PemK/MazF family toxin [Thermoanaerobaculia bacterium]
MVSRYDPDSPRALVLYVPLSTQDRDSLYEVTLPKLRFLHRPSVANVQGLGSLALARLERKIGVLPRAVLEELKEALKYALDLVGVSDHSQ